MFKFMQMPSLTAYQMIHWLGFQAGKVKPWNGYENMLEMLRMELKVFTLPQHGPADTILTLQNMTGFRFSYLSSLLMKVT